MSCAVADVPMLEPLVERAIPKKYKLFNFEDELNIKFD